MPCLHESRRCGVTHRLSVVGCAVLRRDKRVVYGESWAAYHSKHKYTEVRPATIFFAFVNVMTSFGVPSQTESVSAYIPSARTDCPTSSKVRRPTGAGRLTEVGRGFDSAEHSLQALR